MAMPDSTNLSDEAIAQQVQQGDVEVFGVLVERYEAKLLRYGRKFLSTPEHIEEIVQDVFLSAYQNMQSFNSAYNFSPWVYRIAHNAFVNALRKQSNNPLVFFDLDTLVSHPIYEDPKELEEEYAASKKMVEVGLSKLPAKYREVLVLHYFEEQGYKEIADILGVPMGTVGVRLRRAREALKKIYEKDNMQYGD